ncbi:four helix bundle protein [Parasalinivibrio latis]|uniref:four helix bundle protein n=1 Tax=Parasalinivibrio latis TaxID=2952610 RepID=UPI0030E0A851
MGYKQLDTWQRSFRLAQQVHYEMRACKDWGFKDQICRSAVSVPSNIAEGAERGSKKDFIRFLYIAKGSCGELATQILLAGSFGYLDQQKCSCYEAEALEICNMLGGLIAHLKRELK